MAQSTGKVWDSRCELGANQTTAPCIHLQFLMLGRAQLPAPFQTHNPFMSEIQMYCTSPRSFFMGQVRCHPHDTTSLIQFFLGQGQRCPQWRRTGSGWHRVDLYSSVSLSSLITMGNFFFENNMVLTQDDKGQEVKAKQVLVLHLVCIGIHCINYKYVYILHWAWWYSTTWQTGRLMIILGALLRPSRSPNCQELQSVLGKGHSHQPLPSQRRNVLCTSSLGPSCTSWGSNSNTPSDHNPRIPVPVSGVLWFSGGWRWRGEEYRPWRRGPSASLARSPRAGTRRNCCISGVCTWSGKTGRRPGEQKTQTWGEPRGSQGWQPGHPARTGCPARLALGALSCLGPRWLQWAEPGVCWLHRELSEPGPGISAV